MKTANDIVNEIKRKDLNVLKIIRRMKDLSSLAIDLAFAAVTTGDKALAKKVKELEEEIDILQYQLEIEVMLAARNMNHAKNFVAINRIASAMENISDATEELVDAITRGFPVDPSVSDVLKEELEVKVYTVSKSRFQGKTTTQLLDKYDIIGLKKDGEWHYMPKEEFLLEKGDVIILRKK